MNWKISLLVLIELGFILFPANLIGCVDPPDPYDDYIVFFRNDIAPAKGYDSFYYIEEAVMYNPMENAVDTNRTTIDDVTKMWVPYLQNEVSLKSVNKLVNKSSTADLESLYAHTQNPSIPISVKIRNNPMAAYLLKKHDTAAIKYLYLAKQAEEHTQTGGNSQNEEGYWGYQPKDSIAMSRLMTEALQAQADTKNNFLKARYAFQAEKLAFYSHRYNDCIRFYDLVKSNPTCGALASPALGYKAGSLFSTGRRREAAYSYSRLFTEAPNPIDYQSFGWCVHRFEDDDRRACLTLCRNNYEKSEMLGLFLLGSNAPENTALKKIFDLNPGTPIQEVLAVREVNKIERNYLTPHLMHQKGGAAINDLYWYDGDDNGDKWLAEARDLIPFYDSVSRDTQIPHPWLYATVAAQLCYITRQYPRGDSLLEKAAAKPASEKLRDQQKMTKLLLTINEKQTIDPYFESTLLPSLQWLEQKARRDSVLKGPWELGDEHPGLWRQIYRNLLSEIIAKRYDRQKDKSSEVLCIGAAEQAKVSGGPTQYFVRDRMTTTQLIKLLHLLQGSATTGWEKYLVSRFPVSTDEVKQSIAVAHIREHHFHEALKWMKTIKDSNILKLDRYPFADLLFDNQDSIFGFDIAKWQKPKFDKRTFIAVMAALSDKVNNHTATAKDLYKLASGYYNMTYFGRAWETVRYERSGEQSVDMPKDLTDFDQDYYSCNTAESYYRKAMAASTDHEFKARCLFMMAKCAQKHIPYRPEWDNSNDLYLKSFKKNKYFPQLVADYGNTQFYREAYNTCSYLRDFVKKK